MLNIGDKVRTRPAAFSRYMRTKYPAPVSRQYTVEQRGYERSVLVKHGRAIVAEVFTDTEPGDQYDTARLIAAAPDLLAAAIDALETFERRFPDSPTAHDLRAAIARATGADA